MRNKKNEGGCKCAAVRLDTAPPISPSRNRESCVHANPPARHKVAGSVNTAPPVRPVERSVPQRVPTEPPRPPKK